MLKSLPKKRKENGQSLIGILVALTIFSILSQAIFTVVSTSYNLVSFNRARITARHLAQEKIELIRNLPYNNVGTSGGIPSGPLPQLESITRNKLNYTIRTTIIYIDDPFDQTAPNDLLPTDYKRVRIEVSWEGTGSSHNNPVVLLTDISPKGIETTEGGGTLSIIVFDANGNPVKQASVAITAPTNPPINLTLQTPDNGRVILPGAPTCIECYQISVTKPGFSPDRTYSTTEVANPNKPHQTIIEGQLTEVSFSIDQTSNVTINTYKGREDNFEALGNVNFRFVGEKTIGTDTNGQPVYKYDQVLTTNSSGNLILQDMEWDNYRLLLESSSPYDISGTNPLQPFTLLPASNVTLNVSLSPNQPRELFMAFLDPLGDPIASVSATISDTDTGFQETKISGITSDPDFGQVFFSNLSQSNFILTATVSGYLDFTTNISLPMEIPEIPEKFTLNPQ